MTFITLNVYTGDGQRFKEEITVKNDGYIDKAECLRRGYVRKSRGIYKMSLLEKYAARGWLELGDPKYSREDRLRAAKGCKRLRNVAFYVGRRFRHPRKGGRKGKKRR